MVSVTWKRVFISVDMEYKNSTTLNSEQISLLRDVDNFDKKYVLTFNLAILFYILHKSIIGYFLSNIRIKYNVFISILFHLIMNLIFFLLMQLKQ